MLWVKHAQFNFCDRNINRHNTQQKRSVVVSDFPENEVVLRPEPSSWFPPRCLLAAHECLPLWDPHDFTGQTGLPSRVVRHVSCVSPWDAARCRRWSVGRLCSKPLGRKGAVVCPSHGGRLLTGVASVAVWIRSRFQGLVTWKTAGGHRRSERWEGARCNPHFLAWGRSWVW